MGIIAPLLNEEFEEANLTENDISTLDYQKEEGFFSTATTTFKLVANIFILPFWTFGFPSWLNLSVLLLLRIPYWFVIARNIHIGTGSGG